MSIPRRSSCALSIGLIAALVSCSSPTAPPPPPPVGQPSITCPADSATDVAQAPAVITYAPPVVTGGSAPVSTQCTIPSGSLFPSGTTAVTCTATDALQQQAQCVFHVTVNPIAQIKVTRFLAFGDSMTKGENGDLGALSRGVFVVDTPNSYPTVLTGLLQARYASQAASLVVTNEGLSGEFAYCPGGQVSHCGDSEQRFVDALAMYNPDVVLLLEGANDVNEGTAPDKIAGALSNDVRRARPRVVFVSTLLPQIEGSQRGTRPEGITPANAAIIPAVQSEGAFVVDAYSAFNPQKALLISADGLHPSVAGYKLLANLFFDAIKAKFELPLPPGTSSFFSRPVMTRGLTSTMPARPVAPAAGRPAASPLLPPR